MLASRTRREARSLTSPPTTPRGNIARRLIRVAEQFASQLLKATIDELRRTRRVIVTPEARLRGEPPIFLVGVHRSGTTLLRLIIDSHSRIACPPESFFLLPLSRVLDDGKAVEGFKAMGFVEDHVVERLREYASYFFEIYASLHGKARWADKTPSYVDCLEFIDRLYGPSCRFVLIYRHGLDAACSIARVGPRELLPHVEACGGDRFAGAARYWATQCQKMMDFQRGHPGRCLEVRYEDLARDPEPTLRKLFSFVGEEWEPGVLRFHEKPHDRWIGLEDRKASQAKGFAPNIGRYREEPSDVIRRMYEQAGPTLTALGYEVEAPIPPPEQARLDRSDALVGPRPGRRE